MSPAKKDRQIIVQITNSFTDKDISAPKIKKLVKSICERFAPNRGKGTIISIAIIDDAQIKKLNNQFLNHKSTTDCLSFDLSDDKKAKSPKLFELIINGEMALRQANLRGHSYQAEMALYITHGLLHNLGFDDSTPPKAEKMHKTEDEILQQFGYGLVYNNKKSKA